MVENENIEIIEQEYNNPFHFIKLNENLPKISSLTSKYMNKVNEDIFKLHFKNQNINQIKPKIKNKNRLLSINIINETDNNIFNKLNSLSERKFKLKEKKLSINNTEISSYSPGFFITYLPKNDKSNSSQNYICSTINTSKSSSIRKKLLPPLIKKEDLLNSIDLIYNNSNKNFDNLKDKIKEINKYEKNMINKCHKYYNRQNKKMKLNQNDKYLKEKIKNENFQTMKFNDFFDKLMKSKKEYDYISLINMIKNNDKNKKIKELISKQKLENNLKEINKKIFENQSETKKANILIDSILNKST